MAQRTDLLQGTLDLLILKTLLLGPLHGWAISKRLRQLSSEVLHVGQGSLYPARYRLEDRGWISAAWRTSEEGRRAKVYTLTPQGKKQLAAQRFVEAVRGVGLPHPDEHGRLALTNQTRADLAHEPRQPVAGRAIAVAAEIDPGQHDFAMALRDAAAHLGGVETELARDHVHDALGDVGGAALFVQLAVSAEWRRFNDSWSRFGLGTPFHHWLICETAAGNVRGALCMTDA